MPTEPNSDRPWERVATAAQFWTAALLVVMFVGTHMPNSIDGLEGGRDRIAHFVGYAALACSVLATLELSLPRVEPRHYFGVWVSLVLYGVFDEITQTPMRRVCDVTDWAFDVMGATSGIVFYLVGRSVLRGLASGET
ncbi:MAG: VanZ family protein [Planctomycetota bacterium]